MIVFGLQSTKHTRADLPSSNYTCGDKRRHCACLSRKYRFSSSSSVCWVASFIAREEGSVVSIDTVVWSEYITSSSSGAIRLSLQSIFFSMRFGFLDKLESDWLYRLHGEALHLVWDFVPDHGRSRLPTLRNAQVFRKSFHDDGAFLATCNHRPDGVI